MNHNSPEHANMIAAYVQNLLRDMRAEKNLTSHRSRYLAWNDWAKRNKVCRQIKEHVTMANVEVERDLKASVQEASYTNRMAGDRE